MNPQLKKRILDLLWAALIASATAAAATLIPGLKELLGDFFAPNIPTAAAAFTVLLRS